MATMPCKCCGSKQLDHGRCPLCTRCTAGFTHAQNVKRMTLAMEVAISDKSQQKTNKQVRRGA